MFTAMDAFEFPELHDESIPCYNFLRQLSKLMLACGVKDFSWRVRTCCSQPITQQLPVAVCHAPPQPCALPMPAPPCMLAPAGCVQARAAPAAAQPQRHHQLLQVPRGEGVPAGGDEHAHCDAHARDCRRRGRACQACELSARGDIQLPQSSAFHWCHTGVALHSNNLLPCMCTSPHKAISSFADTVCFSAATCLAVIPHPRLGHTSTCTTKTWWL